MELRLGGGLVFVLDLAYLILLNQGTQECKKYSQDFPEMNPKPEISEITNLQTLAFIWRLQGSKVDHAYGMSGRNLMQILEICQPEQWYCHRASYLCYLYYNYSTNCADLQNKSIRNAFDSCGRCMQCCNIYVNTQTKWCQFTESLKNTTVVSPNTTSMNQSVNN